MKTTTELLKTALDATKPNAARIAALTVLKTAQDFKPTAEQKIELLWAEILTAGPEQIKAQVAERHARLDAEYKFCANCFQREPAAASGCRRCAQGESTEWVLPSTIGNTSGPGGWVLRRSELIGAMGREALTRELYLSSHDRESNIKLAKLVLRIFDAHGWEHPPEPYGNHNVIGGQFYVKENGPPPEPKTPPARAGYWSVSCSLPIDQQVR